MEKHSGLSSFAATESTTNILHILRVLFSKPASHVSSNIACSTHAQVPVSKGICASATDPAEQQNTFFHTNTQTYKEEPTKNGWSLLSCASSVGSPSFHGSDLLGGFSRVSAVSSSVAICSSKHGFFEGTCILK
ncbi:hypothetical protein HYALB_00006453 [Hymenoscyphus albidus]|uniref:Uncharacterized protein n=1 Tax=Hymenoscyphus albidus TaxID=595503 RepID=A0A9N9Q3I8_9HELO|nr:hypothetical protein HYALB_00006453 [Hymenoscyphus albidus]